MLVSICIVPKSFSQIVNVEGKRSGANAEGLHGSFDLNLSFTRNIEDVFTYGGKSNLQYLKQRNRFLFLADLSRVRAGGADFIDQGFEHLRYNFGLVKNDRVALEVFQQAQFNAVQLISLRHLSGAGLRYAPVNSDSMKLWGGTIPMFEYEQLTDGSVERNLRQSTYLLFFVSFKKFEFQSISYYQPNWARLSDLRLSTSNTIEFGILKWFRYTISFELLYDSRVPATVPSTVFTFKNGMRLEF